MPDISAVEIPKPLNWQDFQRCCVVLFRCHLQDPMVQEYGRDGQAQNGIDLLGYRGGDHTKAVGIQCRRYSKPLKPGALKKEADKARVIEPPLTELIFATTAERDQKVQSAAAQLTRDLHASGWKCRVSVMAWQDLEHEISLHPDALRAFSPSLVLKNDEIISVVREEAAGVTALIRDLGDKVQSSGAVAWDDFDPDLPEEARSEPSSIHARISVLRGFVRKHRTRAALEELEELSKQDLPVYARYRVLSNIAAVHFNAGRYEAALSYSREAFELRPGDAKAQTNLAFAELATGSPEAAETRARATLLDHPDDAVAAGIIVQSRLQDKTASDPWSLVPASLHKSAEVGIAAAVFLRAREQDMWRAVAAQAAAVYPDNRIIGRLAAEAILEPVLAETDLLFGKPIEPKRLEEVAVATNTLNTMWREEIAAEDRNSSEILPLAHNVASALRFLGQHQEAAKVLDETTSKGISGAALLRLRALLYLHADEDAKAAGLLEQGLDDPEILVFAAQVACAKDPERAKAYISRTALDQLPEQLRHAALEVQGDIAIAQKDADGARLVIAAFEAAKAPFSIVSVLKARLAELEGNGCDESSAAGKMLPDDDEGPAELAPYIRAIVDALPAHAEDMSFTDRLQLAQFLDHHGAHETASDLLHGRVAPDKDSVGLRTYLGASLEAQLYVRAKSILDALPQGVALLPSYERMAATYYWNIGDTRLAAPIIGRLYNASRARLELLLWHIDALVRLHKQDEIEELLRSRVEDKARGTLTQKIRLANALVNFEQPDRARCFCYRLLALNRDDPSVWMAYISTMLSAERPEHDHLLSPVVGPDYAVEIHLASGETRRYVLEPAADLRSVTPDAIAPDHEIALAIQGLKPRDRFSWPTDGSEATLVSSKHKLIDALHTAMQRFNERFPATNGFQQVSLGSDDQLDLSEVTALLEKRSKHIADQAKQYAEGRMPLQMLALLTGVDPIDTMLGLPEISHKYRVAIGTHEERASAFEAIRLNQMRGCVVDAATYHCIRRLQLEAIVQSICGPIGVSQAANDIYMARLGAIDAGGGHLAGSMALRDGRVQMTSYTEEDLQRTRSVIEGDLQWLKDNTETLPVQPAIDPPVVLRKLSSLPGVRILDDIYAASGSGRLMLVDDLFTRQLATQLGTRSTSLQPVLMTARDSGLLGSRDYAKVITDLIEFGQSFIGVDATTLIAARALDIEAGESAVGKRLRLAASVLGGRKCEPRSHCDVVAEMIISLCKAAPLSISHYAVISHLLEALLRERTDDYQKMLDLIDMLLVTVPTARGHLRVWAKGHFLNWPRK